MAKPATSKAPVAYTNQQIIDAATGQWGEKAHEVKPADPYIIQRPDADPIIVMPLTRRRRRALKAAQAAYLMVGGQLAEAQRTQEADQGLVSKITATLEEAERAYDEALFGDAYQDVYDYFDNLDEGFWDAMYEDVHAKLVNRVELPEDVCSKCGQKIGDDDESEGKDESSST